MNCALPPRRLLGPFLAVCLLVCGCSSPVIVKGKLTRGNQPLAIRKGDQLAVVFIPFKEGETSEDFFTTSVQPDGTFQFSGRNGKGIPQGKYRVAVSMGRRKKDALKGEFAPHTSTIIRTVTGKEEILIDLDHPK